MKGNQARSSKTIGSVYFHGVTSNFIEDGSYIRLSYVTLSYDFGKLMKKLGAGNPIKGLRASLTGRNLLLLTKYTGADPQIMSGATSGIGTMGIDIFNILTNLINILLQRFPSFRIKFEILS